MESIAQYGRKAFGPCRNRTVERKGLDIAMSILNHRAIGVQRNISDYTRKEETIYWVRQWLFKLTHHPSAEEQERRADQQAYLDSLASPAIAKLARCMKTGEWLW